jgi:hypothetical protein
VEDSHRGILKHVGDGPCCLGSDTDFDQAGRRELSTGIWHVTQGFPEVTVECQDTMVLVFGIDVLRRYSTVSDSPPVPTRPRGSTVGALSRLETRQPTQRSCVQLIVMTTSHHPTRSSSCPKHLHHLSPYAKFVFQSRLCQTSRIVSNHFVEARIQTQRVFGTSCRSVPNSCFTYDGMMWGGAPLFGIHVMENITLLVSFRGEGRAGTDENLERRTDTQVLEFSQHIKL